MCRHLEILSVRSANLPAGEGVAFLGRNGSDCNVGIEVVDISVTVILAVDLVGYVVAVDSEGSIKANVIRRHLELAVSINSYDLRDILPAGKGVAFLFRMSGSYGYVSAECVGIDVAKLRFGTLLILIEVGYLGIDRNPLCVQIQAVHQNLSRIGGLASCVDIPAAELITVLSREFGGGIVVERRIVGAGLGAVVIGCIFTEIRMVGNVDCNVFDVAVDMDIQLAVLHALILDGVPYDLYVVYVEVVAQNRGMGQAILLIGAVFIPVVRSKETEVGRNFQIFFRNACCDIGNRIAFLRNCVHAVLGERADIAGVQVQAVYAAVGLAARQVEFFALVMVVIRLTTVRQKYEILSRGQFRFGLDRGTVGSPLCVQIQAGHQRSRFVFRGAVRIGVPTVEGVVCTRRQTGLLIIPERLIFIAGSSGVSLGLLRITIVRMISNLNRNTGYIAVNMIAVCQPLNGVPYNCNIIYIKVFAQYRERIRGPGLLVVFFAIFRPVVRGEETEVFRRIQIFAFNAINLGITVLGIVDAAMLVSNLLAFRSQMAFVAGGKGASGNAAVRSQIRQVVCSALAFAARWLITVWQKYEVVGFRILIRCEVDVQRCHADFIFRRIAYYIIILRIVFRTFGNGGISAIARLRAVRTAVCFVVRRSRCGILILGRLCLGLRRSGISGSFGGVCCGSGIIHRYCDFFVRRKKCDVLIVGQRPARAHGQHHDSRKSSCEQTFARILFKHMECLLSQRAC